MGKWSPNSETYVATMQEGDFRSNEKSITLSKNTSYTINHIDNEGNKTLLKSEAPLLEGEIIDSTFMSKKMLLSFLEKSIQEAKDKNILFSLHMKATMMKVSDPIIFGHAVSVYFKDLLEKYEETFSNLGINLNNGFGNLLTSIQTLPKDQQEEIEADIQAAISNGPDMAMVNSDKGITNLHVPSDVIIDASMPAMIRTSGQMWNKAGNLQDAIAVIPDSSYAPLYSATIDFCKKNGAFDPTTMGTVPNVGLMAQKAEEYGST